MDSSFSTRQPYSLLVDICDTSCDEAFWKKKAEREGYPAWFFDLLKPLPLVGLRTISGSYRYLEIIARRDFPPQTLATYEQGELYGMYESFYGLWLAIYRRERSVIEFFYSNLDLPEGTNLFFVPEELTKVPPPSLGIKFFSEVLKEKTPYSPLEPSNKLSSNKLLSLVEEGEGRALEILLQREKQGEISYLPILLSAAKAGSIIFVTRLPLPLSLFTLEEEEELIFAAASSGDFSVLNYYQEKTGITISSFSSLPLWVIRGIQKALLYKADILSIYQVIRELPSSAMKELSKFSFGLTSELALLLLQKDSTPEIYYNILYYNLGNVELLLTLLPLAGRFPGFCLDINEEEKYFPLSWNVLDVLNCKYLHS